MKFIRDLLEQSQSKAEFEAKLKSVGLQMDYARDGSVCGVRDTDGKRFSWRKLGISKDMLTRFHHRDQVHHMNRRISRLEQLARIRQQKKERNRERER